MISIYGATGRLSRENFDDLANNILKSGLSWRDLVRQVFCTLEMTAVTNIAAYHFVRLEELKILRSRLLALCREENLKGTILLSGEGINLFVAGGGEGIENLLAELRSIAGLEDLAVKESESDHQPFTRMLVRIKKEIIAFGVEGIDPGRHTAPKVSATTLKQWLDEGRPLTLLDTRNDYEIKLGTFTGAKSLGLDHFRQFPQAAKQLPEDLKTSPVVMFCTGGIRCEKAGPYLETLGFESVFQLDGGILKYFEECGGAHYEGECFVFDQRVGVDPALAETATAQCHRCQAPLSVEDQKDPRYRPGESCPYCVRSQEEALTEILARRQVALVEAASPLPGSQPTIRRRPVRVPGDGEGRTLGEFLREIFSHLSAEEWRARFQADRIVDRAGTPVSEDQAIRAGEEYFCLSELGAEPDVNAAVQIVYEDEALIVVNKPAPLPMHPSGRFERNTLQFLLNAVYAPQKPRSAHRLDAATTGLVVFARTRHFARNLQEQFTAGTVEKVYHAVVGGEVKDEAFVCEAPIGLGPVGVGLREVDDEEGRPARTEFRVLERRDDGTTLVEARPVTGRTNQIRIHLWQLGHPVCGDPAYLPGHQTGPYLTPELGQPALKLHSHQLSFSHPQSGERVSFVAERPGE